MKRNLLKTCLLAIVLTAFSLGVQAQEPGGPPPPPPNPAGGGNGPVGGGAPIGSGLVILIAMGAAYGGKKIYQVRSSEEL